MTTSVLDTRRIRTSHFTFVPTPRSEVSAGRRANPVDDFSGDNYAARLFIGFNVGEDRLSRKRALRS